MTKSTKKNCSSGRCSLTGSRTKTAKACSTKTQDSSSKSSSAKACSARNCSTTNSASKSAKACSARNSASKSTGRTRMCK